MLKTFLSRKFIRISCFNAVLKSKDEDSKKCDDKLIILTANGIFQGALKNVEIDSEPNPKGNIDILTAIQTLYEKTLENYPKCDVDISENPVSITLEDVTLVNGIHTSKLPFVTIFVDQIIGISMGHLD